MIWRLPLLFAVWFIVCLLAFGHQTQFNTWLCSSWFLIPKYFNPEKKIVIHPRVDRLVFVQYEPPIPVPNHQGVMEFFSDDSLSEFIDMKNSIDTKLEDIRSEVCHLSSLKDSSKYANDIYESKISNMESQISRLEALIPQLDNAAYKTLLLNKIGNVQSELQLFTQEEYLNYQAEVASAKDVLKIVNNL